MLPDDWKDQIGGHDAIFFGAVGWPEKIADHVSLWGSLLLFRREFDQYINLRPARLMPGITAPVAVRRDGSPREPGEIDMYIVRENTEGEYSSIGGRMYAGTPREIVVQETVMSRHGVDRVLKFAFEPAQSRPKKHLTSATKSNGISITMPYWGRAWQRWPSSTRASRSTSSTSTSSRRISCSVPISSTWWWQATCSATSFRTWARRAPARFPASRRRANLNPDRTTPSLRAGARLGAGHRGAGHREPDRVRSGAAR